MAASSGKKWVGLALILAGIAAAVGWWLAGRGENVDMLEVMTLNNRGIGWLEQYDYEKAAEAFEAVTKKAPDWRPGRINLAIALLNQDKASSFDRAIALLEQVAKEDPANNHAEFCLGIIRWHLGKDMAAAAKHFEAVTQRDPDDPHAWFFLGNILTQLDQQERAGECFEKVVALDPYVPGAFNQLQLLYRRRGDDKKAGQLLDRMQELNRSQWDTKVGKIYGDMGKYAEAIGRNPRERAPSVGPLPNFLPDDKFAVQLAPGTRWASAKDFGAGPEGDLRRALRQRFGGTIVAFDRGQSGKLDLYLASAVLRDGKLADLLLANEGGGKFRDITREAGVADLPPSLGCCVADFDNDGLPDLLVTGTRGVRLLRNAGGKAPRFQDVTSMAGLESLTGVCLGGALVDLDQDSDLDLAVAVVGADIAGALANLQKPGEVASGVVVFLNIGEAPPNQKPDTQLPLSPKFQRGGADLNFTQQPLVNLAVSDLDSDRDVDLFLVGAVKAPEAVLNDRLLKFHRAALPEKALPQGTWNGAAILDVNRDEKSDLLLVGPGQKPALLIQGKASGDAWFTAGVINSPPLLQAQAFDVDLDGWVDVVGMSQDRQPILLHNQGGSLAWVKESLGAGHAWPKDVAAVLLADLDYRCVGELIVWSESQGLQLHRNQGNGHHAVAVRLAGKRDVGNSMRCNSDGIGARVGVQVGDRWTCVEMVTQHGGLGQSRQPVLLGLGKADHAQYVGIRWPDGVLQAEMNLGACLLQPLFQTQRRTSSCPLLFTWNGAQFEYITDFLGAGSIGEPLPGGGNRPPRPEESVKIEAEQLVSKDGRYVLKFAEPMDEVTYLDRLRLVVVDHPPGVRSCPDERFQSETRPSTQDLLVFREADQIFAKTARDHRGRDVTPILRNWDRHTADGFAKRAWIGWAEEHWVELDFGDQLAKFGPNDRLGFFLAGWTDYPYPESIWAATQAGHTMLGPVLERLGDSSDPPLGKGGQGGWHPVRTDLSFPAGLPRMMTYDLTGLVAGPTCKLRIRTNMHVYWDQIFIAPIVERVPRGRLAEGGGAASDKVHYRTLDVAAAKLEHRGCMQEFSPDGKEPTTYAYDRLDKVPVTRQTGKLTKFGDVTELLTERDDRFVIFGPGDELTASFAADALPPLQPGWKRSFVLQTWGYCKDAGPFTATGETIEPLPFGAMSNFPYGPGERYPVSPLHLDYVRRWNTRAVGR